MGVNYRLVYDKKENEQQTNWEVEKAFLATSPGHEKPEKKGDGR